MCPRPASDQTMTAGTRAQLRQQLLAGMAVLTLVLLNAYRPAPTTRRHVRKHLSAAHHVMEADAVDGPDTDTDTDWRPEARVANASALPQSPEFRALTVAARAFERRFIPEPIRRLKLPSAGDDPADPH